MFVVVCVLFGGGFVLLGCSCYLMFAIALTTTANPAKKETIVNQALISRKSFADASPAKNDNKRKQAPVNKYCFFILLLLHPT